MLNKIANLYKTMDLQYNAWIIMFFVSHIELTHKDKSKLRAIIEIKINKINGTNHSFHQDYYSKMYGKIDNYYIPIIILEESQISEEYESIESYDESIEL